MANTTARLYIRSAAGYSTPPKKLIDLPHLPERGREVSESLPSPASELSKARGIE